MSQIKDDLAPITGQLVAHGLAPVGTLSRPGGTMRAYRTPDGVAQVLFRLRDGQITVLIESFDGTWNQWTHVTEDYPFDDGNVDPVEWIMDEIGDVRAAMAARTANRGAIERLHAEFDREMRVLGMHLDPTNDPDTLAISVIFAEVDVCTLRAALAAVKNR